MITELSQWASETITTQWSKQTQTEKSYHEGWSREGICQSSQWQEQPYYINWYLLAIDNSALTWPKCQHTTGVLVHMCCCSKILEARHLIKSRHFILLLEGEIRLLLGSISMKGLVSLFLRWCLVAVSSRENLHMTERPKGKGTEEIYSRTFYKVITFHEVENTKPNKTLVKLVGG